MSLHRNNPKRDINEPEIVERLREHGCPVWQLSGRGIPDLLALVHNEWVLIEVKGKQGRLTPDQTRFLNQVAEAGGAPLYMVSSRGEIDDIIEEMSVDVGG